MAGRPKLNALRQKIENLEGGEDYVFNLVIEGLSMGAIAEEIGCSRGLLYDWWKRGPEEDVARRTRKMEMARKLSAQALEEQGAEILDDLAERDGIVTSQDIRIAEARAKYRQWQAESRDRETYGKGGGGGVNLNLNIGELHLEALRKRGSMSLAPGQGEEVIQEADVEVIEEGESDDVDDVLAALQ